jgi:hypothetical protein
MAFVLEVFASSAVGGPWKGPESTEYNKTNNNAFHKEDRRNRRDASTSNCSR